MLEVCCRWVEGSVEGKKRIRRGEIEGIYSPEGMGAWTELAEGEEDRDSPVAEASDLLSVCASARGLESD